MSFDDLNFSFPGLDYTAGTVTLPFWAAAGAAGLLFLLLLFAMYRSGAAKVISGFVQITLAGVAIWFAWSFLAQTGERERSERRQALEARLAQIAATAYVPGSVLACLDGTSGEVTENACERAIFASPENVSAATSYVAARLSLFSEALDHAAKQDPSYTDVQPSSRLLLETDRFGLVAHVLTLKGCSSAQCETLAMFRDPNRVRTNLSERTYDLLVARYSAGWPSRGRPGQVSLSSPAASGGAPISSSVGLSFPSAASIPPVSIMSPEPPPQPAPTPAAAPAAPVAQPAAAPTPPRRPPAAPKQSAAPSQPAPPRVAPPVRLTPSANSGTQRAQ